jgi:hypothetical protein
MSRRDAASRLGLTFGTLMLAAAIGVLLPFTIAAIAADGDDGRTPPADVLARSARIQSEVAQLPDHEWAGTYYEGDGLGVNIAIDIAPEGGVSETWHGCLGLYGANQGDVRVAEGGDLVLDFQRPNPKGFGGFADRLTPVRWGERHYLIPADKLVDFVNAVNRNREPRFGSYGIFPLRRGDERKPVGGLPALPADYARLIRTEPLEIEILAVKRLPDGKDFQGEAYPRWELALGRGERDGIVPGVELDVDAGGRDDLPGARVTGAGDGSARAELAFAWIEDAPTPTPSWRLRAPAFDPARAEAARNDARADAEQSQ